MYHESQKPALERLSKRRSTEGSLNKTKAPNKSKRGSADGCESLFNNLVLKIFGW